MNKILLIIFILVFFLRIETNLLSESIFNVNNININEKYENKEQYLNQVFYKGFSILINRILLENQDLKDTTSINQIKSWSLIIKFLKIKIIQKRMFQLICSLIKKN